MLNLLAAGNDAYLLLHHRPAAHPPITGNRKARRTGLSETERRLLSGFQLDHVTRNGGGIAVQDPGPEPLPLHLGIDQHIAAFGLDGAVLRANNTVVLTNRDHTGLTIATHPALRQLKHCLSDRFIPQKRMLFRIHMDKLRRTDTYSEPSLVALRG